MSKETPTFKPPQVDKVLRDKILARFHDKVENKFLAQIIRQILSAEREQYKKDGKQRGSELSATEIALKAAGKVEEILRSDLKTVINGTGIIINTNLGRAPLAPQSLKSVLGLLESYCDLEFDLKSGKRGERLEHIENLLKLITGCEAALLVNNNAASVFLAIASLAHGKEVVISRGELVEIGGSFRLPDVIVAAGGKLKEVGTTNRTRIEDYKKAITKDTGLILKCHRSNFEIKGFVEEASVVELAELARTKSIPLAEDLGSGAFVDLQKFGLKKERTVQDSLAEGIDLVMFSGDKLLGGPQAGVVLGRKDLVQILRKHPIYRALRLDKVLIALIESILKEYLSADPEKTLPVLAMANQSAQSIKERVEKFIVLAVARGSNLQLACVETESAFGGGTSPGQVQKSFGLAIALNKNAKGLKRGLSGNSLAEALREATPPVIARHQDEMVVVDFRTVRKSDEPLLLSALISLEK